MPRCALARIGLFHEQVVMVQAYVLTVQQGRGYRRDGRVEDEVSIVRIFLPVTEILEEPSRVTGAAGHFCARAGMGKVPFDALCQFADLLRSKCIADTHRTLSLECAHSFIADGVGKTRLTA